MTIQKPNRDSKISENLGALFGPPKVKIEVAKFKKENSKILKIRFNPCRIKE